MKKTVVFGFLGTKLDSGTSDKRWERWRPTVALFGHEHFRTDRLELLLTNESHLDLARHVTADILSLSPEVEVNASVLPVDDPWNFQQVYAALHDFAKSYEFQEDTDYYVHLTTGTHVAQICLFLLLEARYFPARIVETFMHQASGKTGVDTAVHEAWRGRLEVIDLNLSTYDQLAKRFAGERLDSQDLLKGGIATRNVHFNELISCVERVALRSTAPMLLTGPTGAGKSQLARRVYELRNRRHLVKGAFVEVNCATLRGDNAMSTLFGHKKGAFTGAVTDRAGVLKSADGGIVFLDEIGELGDDEQAMLLRALEDKRFTPLGSDKEVSSDFQLLAGTNKDLRHEVAQGRFRADLLARLNVWHFELPGLASRVEDIEPNLDFELERSSIALGTRLSMSASARERFLAFAHTAPWPGNFRDLSASVVRMGTLAEGGRITERDVSLELQSLQQSWKGLAASAHSSSSAAGEAGHPLAKRVLGDAFEEQDLFDLAQLEAVLHVVRHSASMADAGRKLFAASRAGKATTNDSDRLRKYLARFGLTFPQAKERLLASA